MRTTRAIDAFQKAWTAARQDATTPKADGEGYKVAQPELKAATAPLLADGKLTRGEAFAYATQISSDTVLTVRARRDAHAFLQTIGADHGLDAATVAAMKADFSVRADQGTFRYLSNVGY